MGTRIFFIIISLIFSTIVINKVKKKRFFEKESVLWLVGSVIMLILAILPSLVGKLSQLIGIDYPPSLLFLVAIIYILYLLFRQTEQVSLLKEQTKELGQRIVILEKLVKEKDNKEKKDEKQ